MVLLAPGSSTASAIAAVVATSAVWANETEGEDSAATANKVQATDRTARTNRSMPAFPREATPDRAALTGETRQQASRLTSLPDKGYTAT